MPEGTIDRKGRARGAAAIGLASAWLLATAAGAWAADEFEEAMGVRSEGNAESIASQKRIDAISDETVDLQGAYRALVKQADALDVYNSQLEELVSAQDDEMASLREQIDRVELVGRQITPLMLKMIESLGAFVESDVPFLLEERRGRVQNLEELMRRSDVSESEKYRRILEAYQIENEYGRTIESYQGELPDGDKTRAVDFLRVGRVALLYQTFDGRESGAWDRESGEWVRLGSEARAPIRQGTRIARKQAAPDLLRLPIPAPEDAR